MRLGLGVSLQSRVAVEHELSAGTLTEITVRGGLPRREWYALHSATVPLRPAVEQFLSFAYGPDGPHGLRGARRELSSDAIPRGQIAPSLLACDFSRLAEQVELVMDAGAKVIHFD